MPDESSMRRPYDSGGCATRVGVTVNDPNWTGSPSAHGKTSKMSVKSSTSPPISAEAAPTRTSVSAGPYMMALPLGGFG
ncbi:Uncharacterised protein [Mycobacteroides abscessus subsp. abscessus]|nr:Uncharacterised protein [Mycobacteroides abscessus subsp. abscessus]SKU91356.1 Uncharacterised protein [Mycobacteroides abscessus subsp. abscessus]